MSTKIGKWAEDLACEYLTGRGYKIKTRNWRTKFCEIDIIAEQAEITHFIEVKYRKSSAYGAGLDYVTPKKQRQLKLAALAWVGEHGFSGDYRIDVISVDGQTGKVNFIENAIMG